MQLEFQVDVQLDISLNYIEVAAMGLLYLILYSELAETWLPMTDNLKTLSWYLIAVAAIRFPQVFTSSLRNDAHPYIVIT